MKYNGYAVVNENPIETFLVISGNVAWDAVCSFISNSYTVLYADVMWAVFLEHNTATL